MGYFVPPNLTQNLSHPFTSVHGVERFVLEESTILVLDDFLGQYVSILDTLHRFSFPGLTKVFSKVTFLGKVTEHVEHYEGVGRGCVRAHACVCVKEKTVMTPRSLTRQK